MRSRWRGLSLAAVLLASLQYGPDPARAQDPPPPEAGPGGAAGVQDAGEPGTPRERALRHKERGDASRLRDDVAGAGEEYSRALSLDRAGFSREERLVMARYLSWSGRLDEAVGELEAILAEEPGNLEARVHLARCRAWKGDLRGSLDESSKALEAEPGNRDALLARANALKWGGDAPAGIAIYKEILGRGEDFDTRLALSQAWLSAGYVRGARDGAARLAPEYPYQEKEKRGLEAAIDRATRPAAEAGYAYYHDSDENRVDRYRLSGTAWTGAWKWGLGYVYTDAEDPSRSASHHDLVLSAESRLTEGVEAGASAGVDGSGDGSPREYLVGGAWAGAPLLGGRVGAAAARRGMADTAELIENGIRYTELSAHYEHPLPHRCTGRASYAFRDYSDGNSSGDWQGSVRHAFANENPFLTAGYRIRYLDFRRESGGGYFDPSGYLSHKADLTVDHGRGANYLYAAPFAGYQSYRRRGDTPEGFFFGGEWVVGRHVTDSLSLELHGEGSDEAGGTSSGFNYYLVGLRGRARF